MNSPIRRRLHRLGAPLLGIASVVAIVSAPARADVNISDKPTQNMVCDSGVCTPTAQKAILNVGELADMLASGDVTVNTGGSLAKDISIEAPLSWTSTSRLTLDAFQSVTVKKAVTVAGQGALTIATNNGGKNGEFAVLSERGSIQFWDLNSSLVIDGQSYTLVRNIKRLADEIADNPSGFYALAKPYDASKDGTYASSPVHTLFQGTFEGLGNEVSNFAMNSDGPSLTGLFAAIDSGGTARHFGLARAQLIARNDNLNALLVGNNAGTIARCWVDGVIEFSFGINAGAIASFNTGTILESYADVRIAGTGLNQGGGLVGYNAGGAILSSYALGSIALRNTSLASIGGLVGETKGNIENSFTLNKMKAGRRNDNLNFGGLAGKNDTSGGIKSSYAAGPIAVEGTTAVGGLVGFDAAPAGNIAASYWDLDMGVSDPDQGAGNIKNDPGITGLTDEELKSALPQGFDPKIWAIDPNINDGYPYLRAIPPK